MWGGPEGQHVTGLAAAATAGRLKPQRGRPGMAGRRKGAWSLGVPLFLAFPSPQEVTTAPLAAALASGFSEIVTAVKDTV